MSEPAPTGGYDPRFVPWLRAAEDRHFWFRYRNEAIATLLQRIEPRFSTGYRVLEVGCGTGNTLRVLEQQCGRGQVVGMDFQAEGLRFARDRVRCPLVQGDIRAAPFRAAVEFSIVGMFDVLEHIDQDVETLRAVRGWMARDSTLLLTVPAAPALWSGVDLASGHCRRYECAGLRAKLAGAGFEVEYLSPFMTALYPLMWVARRLRRPHQRDAARTIRDELRIKAGLNGLMLRALRSEMIFLSRNRTLPFGSSLIAVARPAFTR